MELQDKIDIITSTVVVEEETENSITNTSDASSSSSSFTAVSGDSGERDQNSAALESSCISCNKPYSDLCEFSKMCSNCKNDVDRNTSGGSGNCITTIYIVIDNIYVYLIGYN